MINKKFYAVSMLLASIAGGSVALGGYTLLRDKYDSQTLEQRQQQHVQFSKYSPGGKHVVPDGLNFMEAAEKTTPGVVNIKSHYDGKASEYGRYSMEDLFREFFGKPMPDDGGGSGGEDMERLATGSGVIITPDGYIATNNHVVEDASSIEVVLNDKRSYKARVVGVDPTTDLALIKIEEEGLPFLPYGNSDDVKVGQWVLAVGNPFELTSTVTAGIVSAKGRSINILRSRSRLSIESFIQTDAAVNPGNSGGALVDLDGNLVGINTAIASNTGSYAGYSFAVPVNLVKKVMEDLAKHGTVQRALMGVSIQDVDAELAKSKGLNKIEGVYISGIEEKGGADNAGLKEGDVVVAVDGTNVNSVSELQELVARKRPGESVQLTYKRSEKTQQASVVLKGSKPEEEVASEKPKSVENSVAIPDLGGEFVTLSSEELEEMGIEEGVRVVKIADGRLKEAGVKEGFVITKVDKKNISSPAALKSAIQGASGGVLIEGYAPDGEHQFFGLGF